jgi:predicted transcriptional regulator
MVRTQIQLDEQVYGVLRAYAAKQHASMAACIRTAIEQYLKRAEQQTDDLSDIAGRFRPLAMEELKPHDRAWADAVATKLGAAP